jgi:hypothetical protein
MNLSRRLVWFAGIYVVSVAAFALLSLLLHVCLRML